MALTVVRMGELSASSDPTDVLVAIGLGSSVGLALVDARRKAAGLAHIMLPDSTIAPASVQDAVGRFADTSVPALVDELERRGSRAEDLRAVLAGGAQMFAFGSRTARSRVGIRNESMTRAALRQAGIAVEAAETGGNKGRTIRIHVGSGVVTVKESGGPEVELFSRPPVEARQRLFSR